ncbi:MAG TPA: glycosyltransferase family 4 protein, partial [Ardenticatenaceae bacterium]|nr:glycosyltransferase family 4 protein [Ardenticatenaceae bacterium]
MRFCLITTFFGPHSFGGDAIFVDRLARALLRQGHEVTVVYSVDAFEALRGDHPLRPYTPPPGLDVRVLRTARGRLTPLWTHQTGQLGALGAGVRQVLDEGRFDVIHFHNVSLIGGPQLLTVAPREGRAVKLMTAHEHWLICPLSSLWTFDTAVCEQPRCFACTLAARRPPQLWRSTDALNRALRHLDALIFPSQHTLGVHRERGIAGTQLLHLPSFLPRDWADPHGSRAVSSTAEEPAAGRPYFAVAGRLIKAKGIQQLIPLMARLPSVDLKIAGTGPFVAELKRMAAGMHNVHFLGLLDFPALARLYREARALVVPSLLPETFGYVVLEALSEGTPAIVHHQGALPELIEASGGGLTYRTVDELAAAMEQLLADDELRRFLGARGQAAVETLWSEERHLARYLGMVEEARSGAGLHVALP